MHWNPLAKIKPIQSKPYKEFIASIPCMCCGEKAEPHHENLGMATTGGKCSDLQCVPLCRFDHTDGPFSRHRHTEGWESFYDMHNIDIKAKIIEYTNYFFASGGKLFRQ